MRLKTVIKLVKSKLKGTLRCAKEEGMIVGKNVTVMSGVPAKRVCSLLEYAQRCKEQMPKTFDTNKYDGDKKAYLLNTVE